MRELVSVKKLNKLSELKVASLDLHIIYSQGVAKELVDANQQFASETFITFTKVCPCCSRDLNIHVFVYEKQFIPLKLRYMIPDPNKLGDQLDNQTECSEYSYSCSEQVDLNDDTTIDSKTTFRTCTTGPQTSDVFNDAANAQIETPQNLDCLENNSQTLQNTKDKKRFSCEHCSNTFSNRIGIKNHLLNIHAPPDQRSSFVCNECPNKTFSSKLSLEKHSKSCHFTKKCPHCSLQFKVSNMRRHIDTVHLKKEYKCRQCEVVCHAKDSLRSHIRRVHNEITASKFQCSHCQKTFADQSRFKRHLMVHNDTRPYCCYVCKRRFREKSNLESHFRTHSGVKPFECPVDSCSKRFADRGSYRNHVKAHEKATGVKLDKSVKKFKPEKLMPQSHPS